MKIPIEVTARHIHIKRDDLEVLFGKGYNLTKLRDISMIGQFACKETLTIKTDKSLIANVRIVGPEREYTQVEISNTDAYYLGIRPPVRVSSFLEGTPGITLISPKGELNLKQGVILPHRHLHANYKEAEKLDVEDGQELNVEVINGPKSLIFKRILVRLDPSYRLSVHIDTDEGNAAGINKVGFGKIVDITD